MNGMSRSALFGLLTAFALWNVGLVTVLPEVAMASLLVLAPVLGVRALVSSRRSPLPWRLRGRLAGAVTVGAAAVYLVSFFAIDDGGVPVTRRVAEPAVAVKAIRLVDFNVLHGYPRFVGQEELTGEGKLLRRLIEPPAVERIRLSSLEPFEVNEDLIDLFRRNPERICPHLHVPIQSGDDAILLAMNRPYRSDAARALLGDIRAAIPDAAIGTDLIAGFPGETEQQFERSLQLVREGLVTHLHVFPFSPRPGTAAATMPPLPKNTNRLRRTTRQARCWVAAIRLTAATIQRLVAMASLIGKPTP